jgi:hypothetical protein
LHDHLEFTTCHQFDKSEAESSIVPAFHGLQSLSMNLFSVCPGCMLLAKLTDGLRNGPRKISHNEKLNQVSDGAQLLRISTSMLLENLMDQVCLSGDFSEIV